MLYKKAHFLSENSSRATLKNTNYQRCIILGSGEYPKRKEEKKMGKLSLPESGDSTSTMVSIKLCGRM